MEKTEVSKKNKIIAVILIFISILCLVFAVYEFVRAQKKNNENSIKITHNESFLEFQGINSIYSLEITAEFETDKSPVKAKAVYQFMQSESIETLILNTSESSTGRYVFNGTTEKGFVSTADITKIDFYDAHDSIITTYSLDQKNISNREKVTSIVLGSIGIFGFIAFLLSGIILMTYKKQLQKYFDFTSNLKKANSENRFVVCEYCGARNKIDSLACHKCGSPIKLKE